MPSNPLTLVLRHVRGLAATREPDDSDARLLARFARHRDEEAFALLVQRHGPLVRGVCGRMLSQAQDAEDVFQATFLVLACKAASIRKTRAVAAWLYGVAVRLARKARADAARQRRLAAAPAREEADPVDTAAARELSRLVDEEVQALSEPLRVPLLLCHLQGRTQEEAARELGWSKATLRRRLERGRELLRVRLTRRGVALPAGLSAAALAEGAASQAVAAGLVGETVRAAVCFLKGGKAGMTASVGALALAEYALRTLTAPALKVTLVLFAALLALTTGVAAYQSRGDPAAPEVPHPARGEGAAPEGPRAAAAPRPDKDAFGDPLPAGAVVRLGTLRLQPGYMIDSVAYTPDGKTLVTGDGRHILVWDLQTGAVRHRFPTPAGHTYGPKPAQVTRDGRTLALLTVDQMTVRDLESGKEVHHFSDVTAFALSPDDHNLAVCRKDGLVLVLDLATGWEHARFDGRGKSQGSDIDVPLAFSPDGKLLALQALQRGVTLWDVERRKPLRRLPCNSHCAAFSPDGRTLALGTHLYDPATGRLVRKLTEDIGLWSVFSPDGTTLATLERDWSVRLWDVRTWKERCRVGSWMSLSLAFSPDGKTLATGGYDQGDLRFWDTATGRPRPPLGGHQGGIAALNFSPDGARLVSAGRDRILCLWDLGTGNQVRAPWLEKADEPLPVVLGGALFRPAASGGIRLADAFTGDERSFPLPAAVKEAGSLLGRSPDGRTLAWRDGDAIVLAEAGTGRDEGRLEGQGKPVSGVAFAPDGRRLAAFSSAGFLCLWETARGQPPRLAWKTDAAVGSLVFSPDSKRLAGIEPYPERMLALAARPVRLWDAATGRLTTQLWGADGGEGPATSKPLPKSALPAPEGNPRRAGGQPLDTLAVAFSPDGRTLAAGYADTRPLRPWRPEKGPPVILWDVEAGKERCRLEGHLDSVLAVRYSPDGRLLATGSADNTVLLWDVGVLPGR